MSESALKEIARDMLLQITTRRGEVTTPTPAVRERLQKIVYGGLLAIDTRPSDYEGIIDACEIIASQFYDHINCYLSVYIPMKEHVKTYYKEAQ